MGCIPSDRTPSCLSVAPYCLPICHQTPRGVRQGPSSAPFATSFCARLSQVMPAPALPFSLVPLHKLSSGAGTLRASLASHPVKICLVLWSLSSVPLPLGPVSTDAPYFILPLDDGPGNRPRGFSRVLSGAESRCPANGRLWARSRHTARCPRARWGVLCWSEYVNEPSGKVLGNSARMGTEMHVLRLNSVWRKSAPSATPSSVADGCARRRRFAHKNYRTLVPGADLLAFT